jgi:glutathione S-transferase
MYSLENYPQFLMLLFVGGLHYPLVTALAGVIWIAGKVSYSLGYYTGGMLHF